MSGPFIFIGTHRIADGKLEAFKKDANALVQLVQEGEPQLIAFNFFFSEDETEVSVVQVHPDADSMLTHMEVARQRIPKLRKTSLSRKTSRSTGQRTRQS